LFSSELAILERDYFQQENTTVAKLRNADIEFLWVQLEDIIDHGKDKDGKTKLELLQRVCRLLDKTLAKKTRPKKPVSSKRK
jgi:hypothetical protein